MDVLGAMVAFAVAITATRLSTGDLVAPSDFEDVGFAFAVAPAAICGAVGDVMPRLMPNAPLRIALLGKKARAEGAGEDVAACCFRYAFGAHPLHEEAGFMKKPVQLSHNRLVNIGPAQICPAHISEDAMRENRVFG